MHVAAGVHDHRERQLHVLGARGRRGGQPRRYARDARKIEIDHDHGGIIKFNPLAEWTEDEVWDYIRANDVPYHMLYTQNYTSIGCAPCTRAIAVGEPFRAGRWWWEDEAAKECGLHVHQDAAAPAR